MPAERYPNAPIAEAIIEIGVRPADGVGLPQLEALRDRLAGEYPHDETAGETPFEGGPRPSAAAHARRDGFVLRDRLGRQAVQVRSGRFVFSRLHPYDRWEPFRDEARRLWTLYREALAPPEVLSLSVRYINRFDLPGGRAALPTYLTVYPHLPEAAAAGGAADEAFLLVRLPRPDLAATLTVTEATAPPLHGGEASVILDLNLERDRDVPQDETELWNLTERFRVCKNEAFEEFVTDPARDLFR